MSVISEEALTSKDRKELDDSMYGIVYTDENGKKVRKYPLNDEAHVLQAVRFFNKAEAKYKPHLARKIVARAKELKMDWEKWDVLKPYLDKPVKESFMTYEWLMKQNYPDPDSTSGTSDFDECINDDEYYGEADQSLMNQIQKNEDNIPILQLRTYAKKCLHEGKSYNGGDKAYTFECIRNDANNQDKRCHEYFFNLIKELDKCIGDADLRSFENRPQKWFRYDRLIKKFFSSIGVQYAKDRIVTAINLHAHSLTFLEKEFVKFKYDPATDILIHRSRKNNLSLLKPSHMSRDNMIYPKPRIYFTLEPRSKYTVKGAYGDCAYEPNINKSIDVFYDTESPSHTSINVNSSKYGKDVFINTYKPLAVKQITSDNVQEGFSESFEEMFGPVIQEAFDAVTGEEIPINHAYTMDEMKERTFSAKDVDAKMVDPRRVKLIPIKTPPYDELYFGSPVDYSKTGIKLDRPLFVTPLKGVASMFVWRDMTIQDRIPRGSFNLNYPDLNMPDSQLMKPLKNVHMVVEGMPSLEPFGVEQTGYIHCIKTKDYEGHFYRYEWMKEWEFLIDDIDVVKFTRAIKTTVKYNIKGAPAPAGKDWGPSPSGILKFTQRIADKIHDKAEADSKEPTGNQNCLLCSWTAEANCRGEMILPRAVYSPRDPALDIKPEDIIDNCKRLSIRGFDNLLEHLQDAKDKFARWYCHVNWKDSKGGHEFLIIRVDKGSFAIMDAQQGEVVHLRDVDYHFRDINWDNSYICRIDNKRFNFTKFERINNATPTPWDPKKDIPYMLREGLITKEEAERELKKTETNLFTSELKKALNRTPIQESKTNIPMKKVSILYKRWCVDNGEQYEKIARFWDIVERYVNCDYLQGYGTAWTSDNGGYFTYGIIFKKGTIPNDLVSAVKREFPDMKVSSTYSVPSKYDHTFNGKTKDIDALYDKIWSKGPLAYELEECRSDGTCSIHVIYKADITQESVDIHDETMEFYKVLKEKLGQTPIQEGAWNDIRNGVNPWSKKRVFHITQQGHLDGQIFNPRVPEYLDKYDPSKDKFEDVDNPRVCFSPSIEGALNAIMVTIGRWKTADKLRDWYVYIPEKPIDQYKHKTTKELVKEKKVYDANVTNEVWIEEPVRLKQYGIIRVDQVSDKHIKKTVPTTTGFQGHRYRYDFKYHWVVKPKVIADVPYDYTPIGVCKDMVDEGYDFKYGLGANGSVHKASPEEYDKNYRLESPEEFEKNGGGICFDFVEWQAGYLEAYGYTCKKYFISTETDDNMTHTFILIDDGNGGFIYPEISFELLQGVHEVKSPEEAIRMIIEKIIEYHKTESIKYYVWEYSDHPPYGSNMDTCLKYFTKGEPFHEGTLNKPEKIK